ncbi:ubiquinone biosynthesis protein COQ4 homolog, mitochondrial [Diorhabda carinulata]|uniref:ubiquinone biosynthesis protein COQ4 homolog, mitochondrial n=1 Tax=Diorhabda carinulata TaxID=1163345 RepID=UPI0025A0CB49|nr:ubiquinone biosynthesis protein COQ4 homolog, mitochondrial [Diorhabda carinulata]
MKRLLVIVKYRSILNYGLYRQFSTFQEDFQQNHIETNLLQRTLLSVGSAAVSILNPYRGDMIACLGETTGDNAAKYVLKKMQNSNEGSRILVEKPRVNTRTVDMEHLAQLPDGTIGKTYSNFLNENKVTPDSRLPVQFIDDPELAYVVQRYREVHDLIHTVLQMRTNMLGEVTVKWVEAIQTKFPMCIGGAIFGPIRLLPKHRQLYLQHYLPWAVKTGTKAEFLLNIYFEKRWEQPLNEFYREMKIEPLKF